MSATAMELPMLRVRALRPVAVLVLAAATVVTATPASGSETRPDGHGPTIVVGRDGVQSRSVPFPARAGGEALVRFTASAPGIDWARPGAESAVVELLVDNRYAGDLVVPTADPTPREVALGAVTPGWHRLTARFSADKSAPAAQQVWLRDVRVEVVGAGVDPYTVLSHAPVVVGRVLPDLGSPLQNATTDTPLLAWHEQLPAATPGDRILEYSVVWSNEDGGTNTPALMARWGRTTDIEWIYRVEIDAAGRRVPGTDVFQAPAHQTLHFTGGYEGEHPVLQTCTANNNMCDSVVVPPGGTMRFFLAADQTRPADRAREELMDANPWTYPVMAKEMVREGKVEAPSDPATPAMGDQRSYLFLEVDKDTGAGSQPGTPPGVAVGVRLRGDPTLYRSDHAQLSWAIARDDPAATTVELPLGTTPADIAEVLAIRQPMDVTDNGAPVTVTSVNRAFFLGVNYLPAASFLALRTNQVLTVEQPTATLWAA